MIMRSAAHVIDKLIEFETIKQLISKAKSITFSPSSLEQQVKTTYTIFKFKSKNLNSCPLDDPVHFKFFNAF